MIHEFTTGNNVWEGGYKCLRCESVLERTLVLDDFFRLSCDNCGYLDYDQIYHNHNFGAFSLANLAPEMFTPNQYYVINTRGSAFKFYHEGMLFRIDGPEDLIPVLTHAGSDVAAYVKDLAHKRAVQISDKLAWLGIECAENYIRGLKGDRNWKIPSTP